MNKTLFTIDLCIRARRVGGRTLHAKESFGGFDMEGGANMDYVFTNAVVVSANRVSLRTRPDLQSRTAYTHSKLRLSTGRGRTSSSNCQPKG